MTFMRMRKRRALFMRAAETAAEQSGNNNPAAIRFERARSAMDTPIKIDADQNLITVRPDYFRCSSRNVIYDAARATMTVDYLRNGKPPQPVYVDLSALDTIAEEIDRKSFSGLRSLFTRKAGDDPVTCPTCGR